MASEGAATERNLELTKFELKRDIEKLELALKKDLLAKMIYFSLGIVSVLGGPMSYLKFFAD